jgi:hypothetical protein
MLHECVKMEIGSHKEKFIKGKKNKKWGKG